MADKFGALKTQYLLDEYKRLLFQEEFQNIDLLTQLYKALIARGVQSVNAEVYKLVDDKQFLAKKSIPVKVDSDSLKVLRQMHDTIAYYDGIGNPVAALAANNIGFLSNIIVVKKGDELINMFNAEVVKSEGAMRLWEACGCVPRVACLVERPKKLWTESLDETGQKQDWRFNMFAAAYADHEIKHTQGRTILEDALETEYFSDDKQRYDAMLARNTKLLLEQKIISEKDLA